MGHVYEVKSPTHTFGASKLNGRLQQADVGLELRVYPAAQLGSESELLEQLVAGEIDMVIAGPSFLAMWHPPVGVFDAAYAFQDLEHMLKVADGPLMAPHWEQLRRRFGVRVLGTWAYGVRHITGNRPIRHPDDLRGFRLRLPAAAVWQASGKALGASPMPIAFAEVYMALQQGIADGQENPVPVIYAKGFQEVQEYLSLTGHIQSSIQLLINERVWQRLTPSQREALRQAIAGLSDEVLAGIRQQEAELLEQWRSSGAIEIIDDVDVAAFEERSRRFFAEGFPFSSLYMKISNDRRPPADASDAKVSAAGSVTDCGRTTVCGTSVSGHRVAPVEMKTSLLEARANYEY
jgi:tripartite ATP-independent transporter DctP family solute receptor